MLVFQWAMLVCRHPLSGDHPNFKWQQLDNKWLPQKSPFKWENAGHLRYLKSKSPFFNGNQMMTIGFWGTQNFETNPDRTAQALMAAPHPRNTSRFLVWTLQSVPADGTVELRTGHQTGRVGWFYGILSYVATYSNFLSFTSFTVDGVLGTIIGNFICTDIFCSAMGMSHMFGFSSILKECSEHQQKLLTSLEAVCYRNPPRLLVATGKHPSLRKFQSFQSLMTNSPSFSFRKYHSHLWWSASSWIHILQPRQGHRGNDDKEG